MVVQGPTLQFKIHSFSTAKDVQALHVKPLNMSPAELDSSPLVVLNNIQGEELIERLILFIFLYNIGGTGVDDRHLQLMSVSFRNMFAPINVQTVKIKHCSRVVLFDRNPETNIISVRHYRIVLNPLGISKSIKRVAQKRKVALSEYKDVSDFVLSQVKASESDVEVGGHVFDEVFLIEDAGRFRGPGGGGRKGEQSKGRRFC